MPATGSRLRKVQCPGCGCIARMSRGAIAQAGLPTCGCGVPMLCAVLDDMLVAAPEHPALVDVDYQIRDFMERSISQRKRGGWTTLCGRCGSIRPADHAGVEHAEGCAPPCRKCGSTDRARRVARTISRGMDAEHAAADAAFDAARRRWDITPVPASPTDMPF